MSTGIRAKSKKILAMIIALMIFFTIFTVIPMTDIGVVYGAGETAKVTASSLNIRSGAGTEYKKIGSLKKGKTFTVTGTKKDKKGVKWYKLKYKSKTGYVSSKYVNIKKVTVTKVSNKKGTVKSGPLNVRKGPGTKYGKLGSMKKGRSFTITGKAKDSSGVWWYRLKYDGKTGYVSSKYVKTSSSSSSSSIKVTKINKKAKVNISSGTLTVRKGPGTKYTSIGSLKKGKTFTATGQAKDASGTLWYRLTYNKKTGYVSSKYVKLSNPSSGSSSDSSSGSPSSSSSGSVSNPGVTSQIGTITADDGLNVRTGAGTGYTRLTILPKGTAVTIIGSDKDKNGKVWYKYQYSSKQIGYICSDYVDVKTVTSDSDFESYMKSQKFPDSYKAGLRALHAAHPQWVFKAVNVGYSWSTALSAESVLGRNLVSASSPVSYRSTASGSYNSKTKTWTRFDGSWYAANETVVAYYMDPRNFLTEEGIYQFMTHTYDSKSQNVDTVAAVIKGSFMEKKNPGSGYSSFASLINAAGKATGVNPNVLAAMIIQEQSWSGSSLVSGTYSGYKGYYNFFNVGAYTTGSMNAVQRGLWYAKGSGTGATSYSRPWNTPYKSIKGGAQFYAQGYVSNNQDSYYSKKFNVYNGSGKVGTHQYMTNVAGAASEGSIVKRAYANNSNYPVTFEIPVYSSMPSTSCQLP